MSDNPFKPEASTSNDTSSGSGGSAWGGGGLGAFKPGAGAFGGGSSGGNSSSAPAYGGGGGGGGVDSQIMKKREQNLEAKEQELKMKEKELKDLEARLKSSGQLVAPKNWPPCCPILRHDIATDIPGPLQNSVKLVYVSYVGMCFCFFWTCLATTAALFGASQDAHDDHKILQAWLLSIIYGVTGIPMGFLLWYMRLYNATQKDRALTYFFFFIFYTAHIMWCVWAFLSPPIGVQWSLTGLMSMAEAFNENSVLGIFYLIGVILWALEGLLSLYCLQVAYRTFRGKADPAQAKKELMQGAAANAV